MIKNFAKNQLWLPAVLVFLLATGTPNLLAQAGSPFDSKIIGYWVLYHNYDQDSVVYIPGDSPFAEKIDMHLKYSGISFRPFNVCVQHYWRWCGNDSSPDEVLGNWIIETNGQEFRLVITFRGLETQKFNIKTINSQEMVLVPAH